MKLIVIVLGGLVLLAIAGLLVFVYVIQNVEQPAYQVVEQQQPFELRDYPTLIVAEVRREGSRAQALSDGFGPLARYIFAKERASGDDERIAMTAPVTQTRTDDASWAVRFIMPSRYRLGDLPAPAGQDPRLTEVPARRVAAVRFNGRTTDALIAEQEQALRQWMDARGLKPAAAPVYAYYNDPFTPGVLRRNEVMIDVADD